MTGCTFYCMRLQSHEFVYSDSGHKHRERINWVHFLLYESTMVSSDLELLESHKRKAACDHPRITKVCCFQGARINLKPFGRIQGIRMSTEIECGPLLGLPQRKAVLFN